jgi:hypothetical protein
MARAARPSRHWNCRLSETHGHAESLVTMPVHYGHPRGEPSRMAYRARCPVSDGHCGRQPTHFAARNQKKNGFHIQQFVYHGLEAPTNLRWREKKEGKRERPCNERYSLHIFKMLKFLQDAQVSPCGFRPASCPLSSQHHTRRLDVAYGVQACYS